MNKIQNTEAQPRSKAELADAVFMLPVGTRIKFLKTLTEPACGDHPALLYATEGEAGVVTKHGAREGYWVKADNWPNAFGASPHEFEAIPDVGPAEITESGLTDGVERLRVAAGIELEDSFESGSKWQVCDKELTELVRLVKNEEREACAKACEACTPPNELYDFQRAAGQVARECAEVIRKRSGAQS